MKKHLIRLAAILSALLLFFINADAQVSGNYNLSDYKLPEIRYQKLETSVTLAGTNNSYKRAGDKFLERGFNGNVGSAYSSYLNSTKIQRSHVLSLSFNGSSSYNKDTIYSNKSSYYLPSISYQILNKRYFQNKIYIQTGIRANYSSSHFKEYDDYHDTMIDNHDSRRNDYTINSSIPLEFGIGRIEQVQDYYQAIYIYEDLLKSGRVISGKSSNEIMELATLISQLKRERYFDFRIKNIRNIEAIDSFLIANNFKTVSDARYYATLVDNWNFVNHFSRESGTTIGLTVTPDFHYYYMNDFNSARNFKHSSESKWYGVMGGLKYERSKPFNVYWQSNTLIITSAGYSEKILNFNDTVSGPDITNSYPQLDLSFNQSISFYPNTRTRVAANFYASYEHYFEEIKYEMIKRPGRQYINADFSLSVDYYISQRLRLNAQSSLNYHYYNLDENPSERLDLFNSGFHVRLAYSIF